MSLDDYVEDEQGRFGWGAPEDEEVHSDINELASSAGTYLYGRRMCETMVYWETAHAVPNQPQFVLEWARQWRAAKRGPENFLGALSNSVRPFDYIVKAGHRSTKLNKIRQDSGTQS